MVSKLYIDAEKAYKKGEMNEFFKLSERLISSNDFHDQVSGYMMKGVFYEISGDHIEKNLECAINNYRIASYMKPEVYAYLFLARALMKQGENGVPGAHEAALRYIDEATSIRHTQEADIAYARYYEGLYTPNYTKAVFYYKRLILSGRFAGFFGYSSVLKKTGHPVYALLIDCARIVLGPFFFLILGKKASTDL